MTKNPFLNALAASLYIVIIACVMFYGISHTEPENSVIIPIAIVSLFTLSAAVMGYVFLSQPVQLFLDGKKKNAINLFIQTVMAFGAITALLLVLLFSGLISMGNNKLTSPQIDYSCTTDSDCVIKNEGNCCGEYPKCMNKKSKPNSIYVQKQCDKNKESSVCGFPSIDGCSCINNKCQSTFQGELNL